MDPALMAAIERLGADLFAVATIAGGSAWIVRRLFDTIDKQTAAQQAQSTATERLTAAVEALTNEVRASRGRR